MTGGDDERFMCLYWAHFTVEALTRHGIRGVIQAGRCGWPRVAWPPAVPAHAEAHADEPATHYSYWWDEPSSEQVNLMLHSQSLPEMHCWAGIPATGEIVDLTTCFLVEACRDRTGMSWDGAMPPDYLWASELPEGVLYKPFEKATMLAACLLWQRFQASYLPPWIAGLLASEQKETVSCQ